MRGNSVGIPEGTVIDIEDSYPCYCAWSVTANIGPRKSTLIKKCDWRKQREYDGGIEPDEIQRSVPYDTG